MQQETPDETTEPMDSLEEVKQQAESTNHSSEDEKSSEPESDSESNAAGEGESLGVDRDGTSAKESSADCEDVETQAIDLSDAGQETGKTDAEGPDDGTEKVNASEEPEHPSADEASASDAEVEDEAVDEEEFETIPLPPIEEERHELRSCWEFAMVFGYLYKMQYVLRVKECRCDVSNRFALD
jgi:hypothetical protein